ncbi:MAG: pyrimidine utilization protein D [Ferrovibrio sp.]|uniref:pyrimidine utilization protein D n=1 Tax=Ferrovibrio sp. TaxID=1917215 RepID=UPI00262DA8F4|nr:pyrimidine utilization protein D [Ferrovibrio sp.]MCW0234634.1 pyrimidine utilization protein D [Ferrovibrio sp.]
MQYDVHGRKDAAAATVLLSAGLGGLGSFWTPQLAALAEQFRVVLYDHRGTGRNAGLLPEDHDIAAMADDVVQILDDLGVARVHMVGHALGGLIGLELALRAPARLDRLVLVNAWARAAAHTARCFALRRQLLLHVGVDAYLEAQPIFLYPAAWLAQRNAQLAEEAVRARQHFQGSANLLRRIDALLAYDISDRLDQIAHPTLVAASRDDILVPWTASQTLAAGLPQARFWLTAEGGHACTVADPAPFNRRLVEFLTAA